MYVTVANFEKKIVNEYRSTTTVITSQTKKTVKNK